MNKNVYGIGEEVLRPYRAWDRVRVVFTRACSPGWDIARFQRWGVEREIGELVYE